MKRIKQPKIQTIPVWMHNEFIGFQNRKFQRILEENFWIGLLCIFGCWISGILLGITFMGMLA